MKSFAHVACVLAMTGFALPSAAQERAAGPIARAAAREADRLAASNEIPPAAPLADWDAVRRLTPGARIVAIVWGSGEVRGRLVFADADGMTIDAEDAPRTAAREAVVEIRREPSWIARHPGPAGLLIGAAVGGVVGGSLNGCHFGCDGGSNAMAGAALFGGIGSGVGAIVGASADSKRETVIYRAR